MKKLLLSLLTVAASITASAESITVPFGKAAPSNYWKGVQNYTSTITSSDGQWTTINFNNNNNGWDNFIKCGNKTNASVGSILTEKNRPEKIKEVVVTIDAITANSVNNAQLYISEDNNKTWTSYKTVTSLAKGDLTFKIDEPKENLSYKVSFDCQKGSGNGLVTVSAFTLNYDVETKTDPEIAFKGEPKYVLTIGEDNFAEFVEPELSNPFELPVTYSIISTEGEDGPVVTLSDAKTGKVSIKEEEGNAVVYATFEGDDEYEYAQVSYAIEVKKPAKKDSEISFGDVTSATAFLGSAFEAPALQNPNGVAVTYSSTNEEVATVAENGAVTIMAVGTTTIAAKFAGNDEYESKIASYTLNVVDPNNLSTEIIASELGYANAAEVKTIDRAPVTLTFSKGTNTQNSPKYYTSDSTIRIYNNNTLNVSIAEGYYITEISFQGTALTGLSSTDNKYSSSNNKWNGQATSVDFNTTVTLKITKITVKYEIAKKTPVLSFGDVTVFEVLEDADFEAPELIINPAGLPVTYSSTNEDVAMVDEETGYVVIGKHGEATITAEFAGNDEYYAAEASYTINVISDKLYCATPTITPTEILVGETVTITCETENATICYTINDGEKAEGTSPVEITFDEAGDYTIEAYAVKEDYEKSEVATATVTVSVKTVTEEVTFDFVNNTYGMTRLSGTTSEYNKDNTRFGEGWVVCTVNSGTRLWGDGLRVYKAGTDKAAGKVVIEVPESVKLKSVSSNEINFTIDGNTATSATVTETAKVKTVTVVYEGTEDDHNSIAEDFRSGLAEHFTIMVDGQALEAPVITKTQQSDVTVSLSHKYPHAAIYTKWDSAKDAAQIEVAGLYYDVIDGYTKHEGDLTLSQAGTLSYYAELNGHQTAVQSIGVEGPTTSISEITAENGEAKWFDLQGRRVANPSHGLYIVNGKKVIR